MYKNMLPIGSVILLKGGNKRVMICGRIQARAGEDKVYDYSACFFPEGLLDTSNLFFFNRDAIDRVFFIGCQDEEELKFRSEILDNLGELEVKNGTIVQKG
jgi:hypothetical protein